MNIKSVLNKDQITTTTGYFQKTVHNNQLKNNHNYVFFSMIMVKFGKLEITKKKFYAAKKPIKIWDVYVDNIVISKLIKTKTYCK